MKEKELIIGLHKNYKLLFERHYQENEKINHRLRENICKYLIFACLIKALYPEYMKSFYNSIKSKQLNSK